MFRGVRSREVQAVLSRFSEYVSGPAGLGLSNGLFCNTNEYAAKIAPGQIVTRKVGQQPENSGVGLVAARAKVQEHGYNGRMSQRTTGKVRGMLAEWFTALKPNNGQAFSTVNSSAKRFTFVTLTLCSKQMHSDNHLKRHALNRFIQECERHHGVRDYFWRAEDQANGNIHFHLLLSQHIPWQQVRKRWNAILRDLGYLELYTAKMYNKYCGGFKLSDNQNDKRSREKQFEAYKNGVLCKWSNPNSTDIHALAKTKNAAAYVCKYVAKDTGTRKIEGRIWGCSDSLRELKTPQLAVSGEFLKLMQEAAESGAVELYQLEHVAVYQGDIRALLLVVSPELLSVLEGYYVEVSERLSKLRRGSIPPT